MASSEARRLFRYHRVAIACAIARQVQRSVPPYQQVDRLRLARNIDNVLDGVTRLIRSGDPRTLLDVLDVLKQQRLRQGFEAKDFLVAVMCGLPVIRRFFVNYASSAELGLAYFEEIEAVLIPLCGQMMAMGVEAFEDMATMPDAAPLCVDSEARTEGGTVITFDIASIDDAANEELHRPYRETYSER